MRNRLFVQVVATVVVVVFVAGIVFTGGDVQPSWLRFYSIAVLSATLVLFAWDHFLWRLKPAQWFAAVPRDLRGTWSGTLQTFWVDPSMGMAPPVKPAYLVIRQTASTVSVVLLTDESRSASTFARVSDDGTTATLDYMYLNQPDIAVEDRSRMHHGSVSFDLIGRPVTRLRGRYWTSRDSRGQMEFGRHSKSQAHGLLEAVELFCADDTQADASAGRTPNDPPTGLTENSPDVRVDTAP